MYIIVKQLSKANPTATKENGKNVLLILRKDFWSVPMNRQTVNVKKLYEKAVAIPARPATTLLPTIDGIRP